MARVELRTTPDCTLARIHGEIDMANVERLYAEITPPLRAADCPILDLSHVSYIDSQGLRLLVRTADVVRTAGGELSIVAPPDSPAGEILELTRMGDFLTVVPAVPSAPTDG